MVKTPRPHHPRRLLRHHASAAAPVEDADLVGLAANLGGRDADLEVRLNPHRWLADAASSSSSNATTTTQEQQQHAPSKGGWYILAFVLVVVVLALVIGFVCCFCEGCGMRGWRRRRRRRRRQQQQSGGNDMAAASDDDDNDDTDDDDECCVLTIRGRGGRNGRTHPSDLRFRQRQERERLRKRGTPAQRRRKILQSFARCKVVKVVQAGHLIPADDVTVPRAPKEAADRRAVANGDFASGRDAMAPTPTQAIHDEGSLEGKDEFAKAPLDRETSLEPQVVDPEEALVMERVDGVTSTSTDAEKGEIADNSRDEAMNVEEADEEDDDEEEEEEDASNGYLQLTATRRVPNCCAVCLSGYEVGEKVVWSPNRKCRHAFHRDCIVDWFVKMPDDGTTSGISTPCPCCRRDFTDLEAYRREKRIRWSAEYAFNPSFITFR